MHKTSDIASHVEGDAMTRRLAIAATIAPALFVVVVVIAGFAYEGYSHIDQKISELGGIEADNPIIQNANFVVLGLVVVGLAWALARLQGAWQLGTLLVAYFGLSGTVAQGFLPCDPGCEPETVTGTLHIATGLSGFVAGTVAMFVLARRGREHPAWQGSGRQGRLIGWWAVVGLLAFVVTQAAEISQIDGLVQRFMVLALLTWIATTGFRAHAVASDSQAPTDRMTVTA